MCIIICKSKSADFPDKDLIERCSYFNDDGAGFMYPDGTGEFVCIDKGFKDGDALWKALDKLPAQIKKGPLVIHCRIGTHGEKRSPECSHPFPVCSDYGDMRKLRSKCRMAVAHNGKLLCHDLKDDKVSDTMCFIKHVVAKHPELLLGEGQDDLLFGMATLGNKFATMLGTGKVWTYGEFNKDDRTGLMFSNEGWKNRIPITVSNTGGAYPGGSTWHNDASCFTCGYRSRSTYRWPCVMCKPGHRAGFYVHQGGEASQPDIGAFTDYVECGKCRSVILWRNSKCPLCGADVTLDGNAVIAMANSDKLEERKMQHA